MILEIAAAAIGGALVGFLACAALTAGKVADLRAEASLIDRVLDDDASHARITDALATKQSRIDRALEQVTPGANATVQRIARILRGEQA